MSNPGTTLKPTRDGAVLAWPAARSMARPRWQTDLTVTLTLLVGLLAWDAAGWDLVVAGFFGTAEGFALRNDFIFSRVLHDGGRAMAWVLMLTLVLTAAREHARSAPARHRPGHADRWRWLGVMLLCLLVVPAIKRLSNTSCPWDQSVFGGVAHYVSHWQWGLVDGGPGHCFPSGHAVAAFGFFGMHFLWRDHDPRRARRWLVAVGLTGLVFGLAQLARGAHYPSHTLWSAWLCWTLCAGADALAGRRRYLVRKPSRRSASLP